MLGKLRRILGSNPRRQRTLLTPRTPILEGLEERVVPATYLIDTTADVANGYIFQSGTSEYTAESLRTAINFINANPGDLGTDDEIILNGETYFLDINGFGDNAGDLDIRQDLIIRGDSSATSFVDGGGELGTLQNRIFEIHNDNDVEVTFENFTITGGYLAGFFSNGEGGGIRNEGELTLDNMVVRQNTVDEDGFGFFFNDALGGGIWSDNRLVLNNSTVALNLAMADQSSPGPGDDALGGGIFNDGYLELRDSFVSGNIAQAGDSYSGGTYGGYAVGGGIFSADEALIYGGAVSLNRAIGGVGYIGGGALGGGIHTEGGYLRIENSSLTGNTAQAGDSYYTTSGYDDAEGGFSAGGAVSADYGATVRILGNSTISGNLSQGGAGYEGGDAYGGGVSDTSDTTLEIVGALISNNIARGGAGYAFAGAQGRADGGDAFGGAIDSFGAFTLTDAIVTGNLAEGGAGFEGGDAFGGGVEIDTEDNAYQPTVALIEGGVISGNSAVGGGGLFSDEGGDGVGGGIFSVGNLTVTTTLIENNVAQGGSVGIPLGGTEGGQGNGGGIATIGETSITGGTIIGNSAIGGFGEAGGDGEGGGIWDDGNLILNDTSITGNLAMGGAGDDDYGGDAQGGGIFKLFGDLNINAVNQNVYISDNTAQGGLADSGFFEPLGSGGDAEGGGIWNLAGSVVINGGDQLVILESNQALGGDMVSPFNTGTGEAFGGAIFNFDLGGSITITNSVLSGNIAEGGDAAFSNSGNFSGGRARGGAIYNDGASLIINDSTLEVNEARGGNGYLTGSGGEANGGAIRSTGTTTLNGVVIKYNAAIGGASEGNAGDGEGGGLWANGTVIVDSSTLSGDTVTSTIRQNIAEGGSGSGASFYAGDGQGGGLFVAGNGSLTLEAGTQVFDNDAIGGDGDTAGVAQGGGVFIRGTLNVNGTTGNEVVIEQNFAGGGDSDAAAAGYAGYGYGGGIYTRTNASVVTISNATIRNNNALGGDITSGSVGNAGIGGGGGIFANEATVAITNSTITGNEATGGDNYGTGDAGAAGGAGIAIRGAGGTLNINIQYGSSATIATAITSITGNFVYGGNVTGGGGGNAGGAAGGGVLLYGDGPGPASDASGGDIRYSDISGNVVIAGSTDGAGDGGDAAGGGIGNASVNGVTVYSSLLSGNSVQGGGSTGGTGGYGAGGGIANVYSDVTVENSTISSNEANGNGNFGYGGGIVNFGAGADAVVRNSTITLNDASDGGGGAAQLGNSFEVYSTIIAGNLAAGVPFTPDSDVLGVFAPTSTFNLIGVSDGGANGFTDGVNDNQVGSSGTPLDPLLGDLQDNDGLTRTHALLPGSTAIDFGDNNFSFGFDQRGNGFNRTVDVTGGVVPGDFTDIGAFELQEAYVPPVIESADNTTFTENTLGTFTIFTNVDAFPVPTLEITGALPMGVDFDDNGDGTATLSGTPALGTAGVYNLQITADSVAGTDVQAFTLTVASTAVNPLPPLAVSFSANTSYTIVGATGSPDTILSAKIFDSEGNFVGSVQPFNNTSSLRVAAGDFDGDGSVDEFAVLGRLQSTDPAANLRAQIVTYHIEPDGSVNETGRFFAFAPGVLGNGFITSGDFDGDGDDDLAVAQIGGGNAFVTMQLHVSDGTNFSPGGSTTIDFGVISAPRIGAGDTDEDGMDEIVVAARTPAGARVLVFDAADPTQAPVQQGAGFTWTFGIDGYSRGAFVAVGEFDPTFVGEEIVLGSNVGGGGRVDIVSYDGAGAATLSENGRLTPFGDGYNAAVRVDVGQLGFPRNAQPVIIAGQDRFQDGQIVAMGRDYDITTAPQPANPVFEFVPTLTVLTVADGEAPGGGVLGPFTAFANTGLVVAVGRDRGTVASTATGVFEFDGSNLALPTGAAFNDAGNRLFVFVDIVGADLSNFDLSLRVTDNATQTVQLIQTTLVAGATDLDVQFGDDLGNQFGAQAANGQVTGFFTPTDSLDAFFTQGDVTSLNNTWELVIENNGGSDIDLLEWNLFFGFDV